MQSVSGAQALALRYAQIVDDRSFEAMRDILVDGFTQRGPEWLCESADAFVDIYEKAGQGRKLDMGIRYQEQVVYADGAYRYARRDVTVVWTSDHSLNG